MNHFAIQHKFLEVSGGEFGRMRATIRSASRVMGKFRGEREGFTAEMRGAFSASGGMMSADALTAVLRRHTDQPISVIARWIVGREIVNFEDCSQRWIPMFQFDGRTMCVLASVRRSMSELAGVFDERETAEWFATPNTWLTGRVPASIIAKEGDAVVEAARADRFVVSG